MAGPLPSWRQIENFRTAPHQRLVDAANALSDIVPVGDTEVVRTFAGTGLIDNRIDPAILTMWVRPTGKAEGHGKYIGKQIRRPETLIDPAIDLGTADLGTVVESDEELLILNVREKEKTTWDLWDDPSGAADNGANADLNPTEFFAMVWGRSTAGKLVVLIDGWKSKDCGDGGE